MECSALHLILRKSSMLSFLLLGWINVLKLKFTINFNWIPYCNIVFILWANKLTVFKSVVQKKEEKSPKSQLGWESNPGPTVLKACILPMRDWCMLVFLVFTYNTKKEFYV